MFAFFINFSFFKPGTENKANLTLHQANAPNLMRCNFLKHAPKLIIFGTRNLHTFKHNTFINELMLIQFYIFNIRPKLHHRRWRKLLVTLPVNVALCTRYYGMQF